MPSAISGFTPTTTAATKSSTSLNGMTSGDFLKLMIQQLQQQDPLNPTDSNQLLTQMSQISTLQSNTTMQQTLQDVTLQQSIGSAGNLIGKSVIGLDDSGNTQTGIVTSVKIADKKVRLELDTGHDLPMENVTQVATASGTTATNATSSAAQIQQLLSSLGSSSGTTNSAALSSLLGAVPNAQLQQLLTTYGIASPSTATSASSSKALAALLSAAGS